jgi:hypothetical protein
MPQSTAPVAIVVPVSTRAELTAEERISLRHLEHHLAPYDKYLIIPEGLRLKLPGFQVRRFDRRYFGSVAAHTKLMLSPQTYEAFRDYEFILLYHLDALVFSDQLLEWCAAGYDYIGAPWLKSEEAPELGFSQVGNGGFSLRRVESFLRVIRSRRRRLDPEAYWKKHHARKPPHLRLANLPRKVLKYTGVRNNVRWEIANYRPNEDGFWATRAKHYDPSFRVAPVDAGLQFAFECAPRYCFEANGQRLPFGCHAWQRHDPEFWRPYMLT